MVNIKSSSVKGQILSILHELSSVGSLVANESVWALTITGFENSDRFNFSKALEELFKRFFSFFGIKTFYIQITSLFRGFVFKAFMFDDFFAFFFLLGRDNIQLLSSIILVMQFIDGFSSCTGTVFNVVFVGASEANEIEVFTFFLTGSFVE
jgi:hypothetical protein